MARLSISLGTGAVPTVRGALDHAAEHPDHDPILTVATVDGEQRVYWCCSGPAGPGGPSFPAACGGGGQL